MVLFLTVCTTNEGGHSQKTFKISAKIQTTKNLLQKGMKGTNTRKGFSHTNNYLNQDLPDNGYAASYEIGMLTDQ